MTGWGGSALGTVAVGMVVGMVAGTVVAATVVEVMVVVDTEAVDTAVVMASGMVVVGITSDGGMKLSQPTITLDGKHVRTKGKPGWNEARRIGQDRDLTGDQTKSDALQAAGVHMVCEAAPCS